MSLKDKSSPSLDYFNCKIKEFQTEMHKHFDENWIKDKEDMKL